ncbi:carbamoyl-phosphate synthase large subunit [Defluviitalea raffinosedens]|uniref:Carbamoyl phosphate synthase large chain n=1 Tax=Defluviitalea raffinosedens TaxID=1450156 RepID=A0A7C8LJW9_9FIRM|nr:carbamoyl-phosphate synthase large subunit [Defluviitalea raffinosedens]KAE9637322.1 carbamoyl-phosphate synthase large subunit [Defluviitalea raffinosedens]MBM7685629.1 carbamoyl-phosphate synthase large subunit [Defluviitalea raffinosedens]
MPKDASLKKVMVIGSGPIIIGQAAEFDYAGTQACKALKEENIEVVLVNSNPATIMTDDNMADKVYIQPLNLEALTYIIEKERPDGLLPTLGGQTGLNLAVELKEAGVLDQNNVKLLGTSLEAIQNAEDREKFKELMQSIGEPIPKSTIVCSMEEGLEFAEQIGFPIIVRPAYTLGGTGGGIANNMEELKKILHSGLMHSRIHQVLLEQSVAGWKEIEYEVMRDSNDTCIIICNMENIDPVGIHTGDSIVVAPCQTLRNEEVQMLRTSAIKIIRALKIEGGCNVQFALNPESMEYVVIEVNPRVSRSSALASKAAGYPIAKIAAKIAIGMHLHEIPNYVTGKTKASFEPAIDYVVTKIPKWPFDKFGYADHTLGTQMKATGEVMAIDRNFESSFLKAVISLEGKDTGLRREDLGKKTDEEIEKMLYICDDQRIFVIAEALRRGISVEAINHITKIDPWFLHKINHIIEIEQRLKNEPFTAELLKEAEEMGFTDVEIQALSKQPISTLDTLRRAHDMYPVYKMVDTCAGEFESLTPYYYSTYEQEDENIISKKEKIIVIGSGPIRIGQGIEFDYCSVHAVWAIEEAGYQSIIINNNPETVSTDFDTAGKLYFEPLYIEDVYNVIRKEMPKGVIVQFGGQTAINLAPKLLKRGVQILGTSVDSIDVAEDRKLFEQLLKELNIPQPKGSAVTHIDEAVRVAEEIGYPVLVRPSYVIGGRAMQVVYSETELREYVKEATSLSTEHPILIDQYIEGKEVEVDAISDREDILIPGIMEHIERTGVHSGDSICVYPPQTLSQKVIDTLILYTRKIAKALQVIGLMNIQFVVKDEKVYVIEVNPRASRTVPILSKVTKIPMVHVAVKVILGEKLRDQGYGVGLYNKSNLVAVKAPVFSFQKLNNVDVALTPEMKSTGEVLGVDSVYEKALVKAFSGAGYTFPGSGKIFVSLREKDKKESIELLKSFKEIGFELMGSEGTAKYLNEKGLEVKPISIHNLDEIFEMMKNKEITIVINTPTLGKNPNKDGFKIRTTAEQMKIPCFTSLDTAKAYLLALKTYSKNETFTYETLDYYM